MRFNCRIVILLLACMFFSEGALAQDTIAPTKEKALRTFNKVELGVRLLPGFSSIGLRTYSGEVINREPSRGYGYMLVVGYNFTKRLGIETGLAYNSFSIRYMDLNLERQVNIKYMNIPLLLSVSTNKTLPVNFNVVAGPQIGIDAGSNSRVMSPDQRDTLNAVFAMKRADLELVYGAGLDFSFSKLQTLHIGIGYRAAYGLTDLNDNQKEIKEGGYYILNNNRRKTHSGFLLMTYGF